MAGGTTMGGPDGSPVEGSRNSGGFLGAWKSNMGSREPACWSCAPLPSGGRPQLYSMNFTTELWSARLLDTKFRRAKGDMTSSGMRGPSPHMPCSAAPVELVGTSLAGPHAPGPVRESRLVSEAVTTGASTWSYQPSESSHVIITAVECQEGSDSKWLMVSTSQVCSSRGSE